jgi:hypothetical protein
MSDIQETGNSMNFNGVGIVNSYIGGLLFGSGLLTAVVIFKVILHVSVCG